MIHHERAQAGPYLRTGYMIMLTYQKRGRLDLAECGLLGLVQAFAQPFGQGLCMIGDTGHMGTWDLVMPDLFLVPHLRHFLPGFLDNRLVSGPVEIDLPRIVMNLIPAHQPAKDAYIVVIERFGRREHAIEPWIYCRQFMEVRQPLIAGPHTSVDMT